MKRKIAMLLTAALILSTSTEVQGAVNTGLPVQQTAEESTGQVDVFIGPALVLRRDADFTVELSKSGKGVVDTKPLKLKGNSSAEELVRFEGLADGEYTLKITGKGFVPYTQNISVKGRACGVRLTTGFLDNVNYQQGAAHPGVLLLGDVNGDGKVDNSDKAALVEAIEAFDSTAADAASRWGAFDLDGNGEVNLVDLEYLAKCLADGRDTAAWVEESVPAAAVDADAGQGTQIVEGTTDTLLQRSGGVVLSPVNGAAISKDNPVSLEFQIGASGQAAMADGIVIGTGRENPVSRAIISVQYEDETGIHTEDVPVEEGVYPLLKSSEVRAERDASGNIHVYLGSQVALKKVTLTIMGTKKNNNLAEISKVEFVNGMENRIPEPEMDIPRNPQVSVGSSRITLTWDPCVNVTGYEIMIRHTDEQNVVSEETVMAVRNTVDITSFGEKKLVNNEEYFVKVQAVNGTWRSGYGAELSAVPKPSGPPDKPDRVSARGEFKSVVVSWKDMEDTESYNLFYKESGNGEEEYHKVGEIKGNQYIINGLKDMTKYTIYVTGVNHLGESGPSLPAGALTKDTNPAVMPKYHLINVGEKGEKSAHIISAAMFSTMEDSPLDTEAGTAWGTVDHDPKSYYSHKSWDDGGYNPVGGGLNARNGLLYEFDQAYKMDTIAFYDVTSYDTGLDYVKVAYWDESGNKTNVSGAYLQKKQDAGNRTYYVIKLPRPVEAKKIQFGVARGWASGGITIADVYFYYYDELAAEIMALYEDDLHTVLRPEVTQADIDALRVRINEKDPVSGEYNPDLALLELELKTAEAILHDEHLKDPVVVHNGITAKDVGRGFGGLNAWQPLGVTAAAQEEIIVYVGSNTKKAGETTNLDLIATQYHAESSPFMSTVATLKVGANKITVPKIWSTDGIEMGGALYVQYKGSNANEKYAVRVSGGVQVPKLDLYQVTDPAERLERTKKFVEELQTYVGQMEAMHSEVHGNSSNPNVKVEYSERDCILGAADILLDTMMLSLPAQQMWNGSGSGSIEARAQKILDSMDAMEDMMYLFYQHKGLNSGAKDAVDQIPKGHLNIRYHRMFGGAFMYASGNHIGIEYPETAGMMGGVPIVPDSQGKYNGTGLYFGWGIAHEIGHCINQGTYAVAEVTNNYFAVLAQARDNNSSVRFQYRNVYDKVTSGTTGRASNVFTQLGMYWQLHLAYDEGYNYKTYENYNEQLQNLFFARVDTYARNTGKAPAPKGIKLVLAGDRDQDLMRLSCAAAGKNILDFFRRWGMVPDAETESYAGQFDKETRAIYYVNDEARVYRKQGGTSELGTAGDVEAVGDSVKAEVDPVAGNQVKITLDSKNIPSADVLGYEIVRCSVSGGEIVKEIAGFAEGNTTTFTDTVSMNNRTVWYEVTLIDQYLNRSKVKTLSTLKIEHDGSMDKSVWTISTEGLTPEDSLPGTSEGSPCEPEPAEPAEKAMDNDLNTAYNASAGENAAILIEFNKTLTVTGFKLTAGDTMPAGSYEIQVKTGDAWISVASERFSQDNKVNRILFTNGEGNYMSTYAATAVRLLFKGAAGTRISVAELDVLGPVGDNVDFRRTSDGTNVIGRLAEAYQYGENEEDVIPEGSIIFTGAFKGNPAYNVVMLYDQDGRQVLGRNEAGEQKSQQIILATVPDKGDIPNVYDGTWIYWIEPDQQIDLENIKQVRAELYRVNNALNNEGQRLVSDSLFENMPANSLEQLPEIRFEGGSVSDGDAAASN